jgi:Fanconi anemia group M protein
MTKGKCSIKTVLTKSRDYQHTLVENGLFENSLVVLPTGLGKTFIAAVIMYNYFRWFPEGKIIFMAHSKPLVMQQVSSKARQNSKM